MDLTTPMGSATAIPLGLEEAIYRIDADEFLRMAEGNAFREGSRIELWDGILHEKMAKTRAHDTTCSMAVRTFYRHLPPGWYVAVETTLNLGGQRAPLPDLMIVRGEPEESAERRIEPRDLGLVIENAQTSLGSDTGRKLRGYAAGNVPQYWVIDLVSRTIHVFREPVASEERYAETAVHPYEDSIAVDLDGNPVGPIPVSTLISPK
jgi:Uma2 family endonuclease